MEVIAEDLTNNKEGLFVGLNEIQRRKLRRDVGDAVMVEEVVDGKSRVRAFMVGTHLSKNHNMPEVVSISDIALLKRKITIRAPHADLAQEKMVYATAFDLEKDDKHTARIGKVRNALEGIEGVEPEAYVSIPAGLMKLYGFKASDSPTVLKVDKATLVYKGKELTVGVIPGGREIRFTTTAVEKMNIKAEQLQVSIRNGKLILEDVDLQEDLRFTLRPAQGDVIQYEEKECPVIEFFCFEGAEYPVIDHPLETPPELINTGALGFDPVAKVIKMRGVPEAFRVYGYFNEVRCPEVLAKPGACRDALVEEVPLVPPQQRGEYLKWRVSFFEGVHRFCMRMAIENSSHQESWKQYANEMLLCVDYLHSL